jgi:hypothetical protein
MKQVLLSEVELAEIESWYASAAQESQTSAGISPKRDAATKALLKKLSISLHGMDKYAMTKGRI